MLWNILKDVKIVKDMPTTCIKRLRYYIQLHPPSWPFNAWGIDVVGPIHPPSSHGHHFILAATYYFSKWAEAEPLAEVKTANLIEFMCQNMICRFKIPHRIIHYNGPQFKDHRFQKFCDKYHIRCHAPTAYNLGAKGLYEAFNKTICRILKKMVSKNKRE